MSKNSLEVYKIGNRVKLSDDIYATIVSINIRGENNVSYECGWWNGRSYDTKWFYGNEFEPADSAEKIRIGFA